MIKEHLESLDLVETAAIHKRSTIEDYRSFLSDLIEERGSQGDNTRVLELVYHQALKYKHIGPLVRNFYIPATRAFNPNTCRLSSMRMRSLYLISQKYEVSLDYLLKFTDVPTLDPHYQVARPEEVFLEKVFADNLYVCMSNEDISVARLATSIERCRVLISRWLGNCDIVHLPNTDSFNSLRKVFPKIPTDAWFYRDFCRGFYV